MDNALHPIGPSNDPSALTTQLLEREFESLRALVFMRLDAMDKAIELAHADLVRVPTDTDKAIARLRELHDEKFAGIAKEFELRDTNAKETSAAAKSALEAAFQAAGDKADKAESGLTKQIDSLRSLLESQTHALSEKIDDVRNRVTSSEGRGSGLHMGWLILMGAIAAISAGVAIMR